MAAFPGTWADAGGEVGGVGVLACDFHGIGRRVLFTAGRWLEFPLASAIFLCRAYHAMEPVQIMAMACNDKCCDFKPVKLQRRQARNRKIAPGRS